jgi:drug/metabolite transporter (DMT)-like permease
MAPAPIPALTDSQTPMLLGTLFALAAGLMWGLVFVAPLLLPEYPALLLSVGRYLAFGLIALPLGWLDRARLARLSAADWREALKLSAIGNLLYYLCLAGAIQRAGGPLPTMIIGTLPVVIAITSNLRDARRDGRMPWRRLAPSLLLIAAGIGLVNHDELARLQEATHVARAAGGTLDVARYAIGALLAVAAVACWTWYPIRNADWLRAGAPGAALSNPAAAPESVPSNPVAAARAGTPGAVQRIPAGRNPRTWATAQGLATLPLAAVGFAGFWLWSAATGATFTLPFGPAPERFVTLMLAIGLFASWLGTTCWNEASQRLPTTLAGQLIVFETLSALAYAFVLRAEMPPAATLAGIVLLIAGVVSALRVRPLPLVA